MKTTATQTRFSKLVARVARRRLLVRVRPMALAAAVAMGATGPVVLAQTIITPLKGSGQGETVVTTQGNQTIVSTQSLRDGNAFSTYSSFQVGQGDTARLAVPQGANWWVNIVRDARVRVDGRLESRLTDGRIGGNILFVDSHGFAVGPSGQVDVGRLTFAAPSTSFVDGLLAGGGTLSSAAVNGLLAGEFERSATGAVDIRGRVSARDGVSLMAGAGGGADHAVRITGQVVLQGRVAGSAVNLGDLKTLTPLQDRDGVIDITTPGSIMLDGTLISDSALWRHAGAVRVVAGADISVGANARVSASGAAGSGEAGGQIALFAHRDIANASGAVLRAHGDGAGAGGGIEYSSVKQLALHNMTLDAGSDAGIGGLVYLDPEDATITQGYGVNPMTGGASFIVNASKSITVTSGTVINTRKVADGADARDTTVASTGDSGKIGLTAPSITVEAGSLLDASVVNQGGTTYVAGDIALTARDTSNWVTLLGLANANASIDVAGTLKGRNVTLDSSIESSAVYDGVSAALTEGLFSLALKKMDAPLALTLAYVEAKGNATVTVRDTAVLQASKDLAITATADRSAGAMQQIEGSAKANLSAGFANLSGTTKVDIQSGAVLSAGEKIDVLAASKTRIEMASATVVDTAAGGTSNAVAVVFSGSLSDVDTNVNVGSNAVLTSGTDTNINAFHSGYYDTKASVKIYGSGAGGVVGALSLQASNTAVTVDGSVNATGNVHVMALNASAINRVTAESSNASGKAPLVLPETLELSDEEAKGKLATGYMAMASKLAERSDTASGAKPSAPALRMAGAMTWSESTQDTLTSVGAGSHITAGGDVVVDAQTLVGQLRSAGNAAATSKTKGADGSAVSLSAAFNYADHAFSTQALAGADAQITGAHVAVHASTDTPAFFMASLPLEWDNFYTVYKNLVDLPDVASAGFNSDVGATSVATDLALSGAVNLSFYKNSTRAWVDTGAHVTTTAVDGLSWKYGVKEVGFDSDIENVVSPGADPYRLDKELDVLSDFVKKTRVVLDSSGNPTSYKLDEISFERAFTGSLVVKAENHVQTLHMAGGKASKAGAGGTSVGGTFSMVDRENSAIAGIADAAVIHTHRLDVSALNSDWLLSVSPTAGSGAGVAANGMVSYNKLKDTTLASISREAQVTAPTVNVDADLSLWVFAVTGAVTKSENSGVGIGVAMNELSGNTKAYVGDNDADSGRADTAEGSAGWIKTGHLTVDAQSKGLIGAVGVAGAMAGGSSSSGMGSKADAGSASAQPAAGGSGTAPLSGATDSLQSQGAAQSGGDAGASTPPKFSIAGAGAIVTNFSDIDTTALVDRAVVKAVGAGTTGLTVRALSDLSQISVAGGGALAMANNSSTTFSSAIAGAAAIQGSDDDTTARIVGSTISDVSNQADGLTVQALKSGERTAVATGISVNLSKGSTSDLSVVGSVSITQVSDSTAASIEDSTITGAVATPNALDAQVLAYDRSRIGAGGGALSFSTGKGSAGIGATVSVVDLQGSTSASVIGGSISQVHDLTVAALSSQKVVGVGAVAGVQTGADSKGQLMGAFVFNEIGNTISAGITGGARVNLSGDLSLQSGGALSDATLNTLMGGVRTSYVTDYDMASSDNGYTDEFKSAVGGESIVGVAGTLSVTLGNNANSVGLSYVQNNIQSTYTAELNGDVTAAGQVSVNALSHADIVGISAGLGATKGKFSGMGSASVNLIGQQTQARVTGGSVNAAGLTVDAGTSGNLFSLAGNLSFAVGSGTGTAAGGAVSYTQTGTRTYTVAPATYELDGVTYTEDGAALRTRAAGNQAAVSHATVNVGSGDVKVLAHNTSDTMSVAASGAGSTGNAAFAGTATWNEIGDVTDARVSDATVTAKNVTVQAGEGAGTTSARVQSLAGGLSASKGYSAALAFGFNTIESSRSAQILSSTITASDTVSVKADAQGSIETLSATLAGGKDYTLAGSSSVNWLNGTTNAAVENTTIGGTASSLTVHAAHSGTIQSMAGAVSGSATGAIGGAVAVNLMGDGSDDFKVTAGLRNSTLSAPAAVQVDAALSGAIGSVAASGSGAGTNAINGSVTRNVIAGDVSAEISGLTQSGSGGAMRVLADQSANISSLAGVIGGAGTNAIGGAIAVNDIASTVTASLTRSTLRVTDAVAVEAGMDGTIRSVAAAGGGAGTTAVNGSNTTNSLTSAVKASASGVTQAIASTAFDVLASDDSSIESLAGAVSGGGTAGAGAALAQNFLGRTAGNAAAQKLVQAEVTGSSLQATGAVRVEASSDASIHSLGVAAGGGGTFAVTGSNTTNILEDTLTANWSGSTLAGANGGALTIKATDDAEIQSLAGNFAGGGTGAVGAAAAVNRVGTSVRARLSGTGSGGVSTGDVEVRAASDASIDTVAVGMSASGTVGVQGSVAVSMISSTTSALVDGGALVEAWDSVAVTADSSDRIKALAGAIGLGLGGVGAAGGVQVNQIASSTTAGMDGATTKVSGLGLGDGLVVHTDSLTAAPDLMNITAVTDTALSRPVRGNVTRRGVMVQATSIEQIAALTAVVGGGTVGVGASVNVDNIAGSTRAYVDSASINATAGGAAAQEAQVLAADHALIASTAATAAGGATVGVAGAVGAETVKRSSVAEVLDGASVQAVGDANVKAVSTATVAQISAGAGGGGVAGAAGSGNVVQLGSDTLARVDHATIAANNVSVLAEGANRTNLIAGSMGGGGVAGVGLSFTVNVSGSDVRALVSDSVVRADGAVAINATNRTEELAVAATAGGGGIAGVAIGAAVTVLEGHTEAAMTGSSVLERRTRATGSVASAGDAAVTVKLDAKDGIVTADSQGATRFVLMQTVPAEVVDGVVVAPAYDTTAALGAGALLKVFDGTREVTAKLNADGSYSANLSTLGDGQLTAVLYTSLLDGVPVANSPSSRVLFTKAAGAGSLSVAALETVAINHNAGGIGAGGVAGVGSAANVVIGRSKVAASAAGSAITVGGGLSVTALREAEVDMITATAGGGGIAGVSGAVGVLIFGSAPGSDANAELNNGSGSTVSRVSAGTASSKTQGTGSTLTAEETTTLDAGGSYDTQGAFTGASGKHSTSAILSATNIRAGSVTVSSLDRTSVDNNAGAVAGGAAAGVSAGVAVTILGGANSASVNAGQLTSQGSITIESGTRTPSEGTPAVESRAVAGAGGFVGVGAAVSVASNKTVNSASLSGQVSAGGAVSVKALDQASMNSEAWGATVGVASVGVVVATAEQAGSVTTQVRATLNGQGIAISAERDGRVSAYAAGGSGGVVAGTGAGATASDSGTVSVGLASGTVLDAGLGELAIVARTNPTASAEAVGVAVAAGGAVGVSVAEAKVASQVSVSSLGALTLKGGAVTLSAVLGSGDSAVTSQASAGAGALLLGATGVSATSSNKGSAKVALVTGVDLLTTGDVAVTATDSMTVTSSAVGIGAGMVGLGVALSSAVSDTSVAVGAAGVKGRVGGSLQVSASGNESINSDAVAGAGGTFAGAGAEATVNHDQAVRADLGGAAGASLQVSGRTTIEANRLVRYDGHTTSVSVAAVGASGAVTKVTLDGSASASLLDGTTLNAGSLRVLATNDLARTDMTRQSAEGGGGGLASGAGASVITELNGDATASIGKNATILLEDLLEVRAYNEMHGSSRGQMDVGGAIPIALVETRIQSKANADAVIGQDTAINVYGQSAVNALSYVDIEANSVSKTYGLAGAAQGNAYATANVNNRVTIGAGSELRSTEDTTLLAGQDLDFNRNKHFVTARVDLFNHSAIPVSINPQAEATLNLNNALTVDANAIRSGGTIKLGGVEGTHVVEGKGTVSDWTRDLGELVGLSSEYGSSSKDIRNTAVLNGEFEAGFGNKQRLVIGLNGQVLQSEGDVRYTITNEDLSASASAYVERLYDQLARYGDVPEVKAFVEAELSFYFATLLKEGLAEELVQDGKKVIVASSGVAANFLNIKNLRAGSGNIELFGNNVTGTGSLTARADSEIYIENQSPLNLRVYDMTVDANGGFAKYNGTYLKSSADIAALNTSAKTTSLSVDSIDTRGGGASQQLPKLTVKNTFVPLGTSASEVRVTAPDGTWADLREDEMRAPEMRVNGWLYNKLGTVSLSNTAGSISVYAEDPAYTPRLDGKEIQVTAGKNFVLSSPSISQSVGGSPESLYAVHYSDDQQRILGNLGITACGSARPGVAATYNADCLVNGAGGVYASGGIFLGARYLNINGTVQSGQADFNVTLSNATVGTKITNWKTQWQANRGQYLSQGKSSLLQVSGPLPTDSESEINKQFANGTITAAQRTTALAAMAARRLQPIVYYDAEANRLKVAANNVQGGLVELVGSIINTGGGVVRALDGYAKINIDNQTAYGMDLLGLDTGGDAGIIRITDLGKPVKNADGSVRAYEVTTYQRAADGNFKATVTEGRGVGAAVLSTTNSSLASPDGSVKARFSYSPLENSTYSWSAGYEYSTEKRYYYSSSSWLGFIPGGTVKWNSVDTYVKTANAMPEDVYVSTTVPVGGGNFSIDVRKVTTDVEKEIYYRSWKKCGFLCIKKTYYVDRRTEVGMKDIFTQRVAADNPINIELVGYDAGALTVKSVGDIRLGGNITNDSGAVSLTSTNGSITQLNGGAVVDGVDLNFRARTGIGSQASPINLITGAGAFTAVSDSGEIGFHGNSGALRVKQVATTGNVWLDGDDSIIGLDPAAVHVKGHRIYLSAPKGSIGEFNVDGSVKSTLNIDSADATNGGLSAYSRSGIAINEMTGNLWVNQVATGGDVYLAAPGDLIDNNRNETRDERTEAQLLALWDQAALQGDSAKASLDLTLATTRAQFRRYWSLRDVRSVVTDASGNVTGYTADPVDPLSYRFTFSADERQHYLDSGIGAAQITAIETARTAEMLQLHAQFGGTAYQTDNDRIITAVNVVNAASGKPLVGALAEWTDAELKSPLPKAVFSKSSTDTQTRIEEPNVVGNRVVLRPGGKIGKDDGQVLIPLLRADRLAKGLTADLTADERLAIMSAETDDMRLDRDTWTLTVVKKDTFNVLSNRLNVTSSGFIYLGADTTASYPNGGTANLEKVIGTGEIRIKVTDSILSVADAGVSVIQGQKAILEAAQGAIGSADKAVQITLANNSTGTLTARAKEGIWIHEIGDLRAADIYTPASATLSATGAIIDARPVINYPETGDRSVRSIEANALTLNALGGAVGERDNPMVVKVGAGGVNATSAKGYSVYLQASEGASLTLKAVNSGLDVFATSALSLDNIGSIASLGGIYAEAGGDITGVIYTASGAVELGAGGDITGTKVSGGSGNATLNAGGAVALTSLSSGKDVVVTAKESVNLTSATSGRDLRLTALGGGVQGVAWSGANNVVVTAHGAQADVSATSVSSSAGAVSVTGDAGLSLGVTSGLRDISLTAARGMRLLNVTSSGGALTLEAGDALSLLAGSARNAVVAQAGTGLQASSLSSTSGRVTAATQTGALNLQTVNAGAGATLTATAGSLAAGTLKATSGDFSLASGGDMAVTSASAPGNIVALAGGKAEFGTLTSSLGLIDLASTGGLLKVSSAVAKTGFDADAAAAMNITTLTVSGGGARATAGGDLNIRTATTTGAIVAGSGGNGVLDTMTSSAGGITADITGSLQLTSARASTLVDLSAGTGLTAGTLTSLTGNIAVDSVTGLLKVNAASAKTTLEADALNGALTVGSFTASSAKLHAGTALSISTTGTTTGALSAASGGNAALATLTSSAGAITADAGGAITVTTAKGASVDLSAGTGLTAGTLTSLTGNIAVESATGPVKITSAVAKTGFAADAVKDALTVGAFTAASANLHAGTALTVSTTGTTSDASAGIVASSGGTAALGTLTSAGSIQADAVGAMTVTSAKGATAVGLAGGTGVTTGALTSTTSSIDVNSLAGSVTVGSATGKTRFAARSGGALTVKSFTVTAGGATLDAGGAMTLTTGTTTGDMAITSAGNAALGTLTASSTGAALSASSTGRITATSSGGGLTFATLKAGSGIRMDAARAWSVGNALSGTALYVGQGSLDLFARSGNMTVGTLSVLTQPTGTTSKLKTGAGSIKVSTILGLKPGQLVAEVAGGTKTLPTGF